MKNPSSWTVFRYAHPVQRCRRARLSRDLHENWSHALRELRYALELDLLNCEAKRHEYAPCTLLICANHSLRLMFNAHFHKIQSGSMQLMDWGIPRRVFPHETATVETSLHNNNVGYVYSCKLLNLCWIGGVFVI